MTAAETKLKELEAPRHAKDMAGVMVGRHRLLHALGASTAEQVEAAEKHHEAMKQAHAEHMATIDPAEIDATAQAVIDERAPAEDE